VKVKRRSFLIRHSLVRMRRSGKREGNLKKSNGGRDD